MLILNKYISFIIDPILTINKFYQFKDTKAVKNFIRNMKLYA